MFWSPGTRLPICRLHNSAELLLTLMFAVAPVINLCMRSQSEHCDNWSHVLQCLFNKSKLEDTMPGKEYLLVGFRKCIWRLVCLFFLAIDVCCWFWQFAECINKTTLKNPLWMVRNWQSSPPGRSLFWMFISSNSHWHYWYTVQFHVVELCALILQGFFSFSNAFPSYTGNRSPDKMITVY